MQPSRDNDSQDVSRRAFLAAVGGGAATALAGCTGGSNEETKTTESDTTETDTETEATESAGAAQGEGQTLELINSTMTSLDPVAASDTASSAVVTQIFDGLMTWPKGQIPVESVIAKDYQISDDFKTYTFTLKEGVTFHNGKEVTAKDFVYSYERLAASPNSLDSDDILNAIGVVHETDSEGSYVPQSMAIKAVDDYTLEMTIEQPFHSALQVLANDQFGVLPEGIVGDIEGYDGKLGYKEFSKNPVGAGPFEFESWQANTEASVTAYDDYHGSGPKLAGVRWQIIEDDNALYNYAMNRNADVFTVPTAKYDANKVSIDRTDGKGRKFGTYGPLRNGETANYLSVPTLNIFYIGFNMPNVEKAARQATAYALNQQTVIDQVFKGRGVPAYHYTAPSVFPAGADAYKTHAKEKYPYGYNESQLDKARQVMEEAGYDENNRYKFTFTTYQSSTWQQTGQILRDQLTSAHIDMKLEQAPFSTLLKRVREGNIQAFSLGWIVPWAAPDAFTKHINAETSRQGVSGRESYNNWPETPAAKRSTQAWKKIEENSAPSEEAQKARNEAYLTMEEANWEDVANLPVYHESEELMWYDNVKLGPFGAGGSYRRKYNEATKNE